MSSNSTLKFMHFLNWCDYWRYRGVKGIYINYHPHMLWAVGTGTCKQWFMKAANDNEAK